MKAYAEAIALAVTQGYNADTHTGTIFGKSGRRLSVKRYGSHGSQAYPTIRLHIVGMDKLAYTVPAHKFVAYLVWGPRAFSSDLEVRHLDGATKNIRRRNLALGTSSQNQLDKPRHVRVAATKAARASQGTTPRNAKLTRDDAEVILTELGRHTLSTGRVCRGIVKKLAERFNVSRSTISLIWKGKSWTASLS